MENILSTVLMSKAAPNSIFTVIFQSLSRTTLVKLLYSLNTAIKYEEGDGKYNHVTL